MRPGLAHSLLLILLLAFAGPASAASCGSAASDDVPMPMSAGGDHQSHCSPSTGGDCDPDCGCCPGHCTSLLPAGDVGATVLPGNSQTTAYREFNTSPDPETALRPPILR